MSSINQFNLDKDEKPIAKSFLRQDGDESNTIFLTSSRLVLIRRSRFHDIPLSKLSSIYIATKKLLLPIIAGGITASLSVAALYVNSYNPYYLLIGFLAGLGLLYWGYTGSKALCIVEGRHETNLFLRSFREPLIRFVDFVNVYKNTPSASLLKFYLVVNDPSNSGEVQKTHLLSFDEVRAKQHSTNAWVAEIDSSNPDMRVIYRPGGNSNDYRPYLQNIHGTDKINFVPIQNLQELFSETF